MGRFDYNPIPAGVTNASELFEIVKEYTATKIEERAAKQWDIKNEYYGTNFITGENVDKIMNGAYILFPKLNAFVVTKKKKGDDFTASLSVSVDIYAGKNTGTVENPVWTPKLVKTITASGSNALGSLFDLNLNPKKEDKRKKAIKAATNGMLLFLEKELKKVDVFKIKALVTKAEPKKDKIAFNFGKNVGVNVDDAYTLGYFQKNKKGKQVFVETGYMKVRKVKDKESVSQLLIVRNPKNEDENNLFNEYDQCYEYPLVGLNFIPNFGLINGFKSWENHPEAPDNFEEIPGAGSIGLRMEYDIAKFVKIPELYFLVGGDLILTEIGDISDGTDTFEYTPSTVLVEGGLAKKFFKRRFAWYLGASALYEAMTLNVKSDAIGYDEDFNLASLGFKGFVGINYMLSKTWFFDFQASFAGMAPLMDEDGNEVLTSAADDVQSIFDGIPYDDVDETTYLVPSGLTIKLGIGFTL